MNPLSELLRVAVESHSGHTALVDGGSGQSLTYGELWRRVNNLALDLQNHGVTNGDRVGIALPKGFDSFSAIFAILQLDAAYVPVDANAPADRNQWIFDDCLVSAIIDLDEDGSLRIQTCEPAEDPIEAPQDLAYILYTSGSTGKPKGVMLSHGNAMSFIDWASEVLEPNEEDRFSSHAPFHFDLSILDIYVAVKHAAAVVLIDDTLGKNPRALGELIANERISIWYSTPTILRLLMEFGDLGRHDCRALRWVLFAGEVFPITHLKKLRKQLPAPRFGNLYGPTETNVCTWLEIPDTIPERRHTPFEIGHACSNVSARVVDEDGNDVAAGKEGELVIAGGPVMQGYWNRPERTAQAFFEQDGEPYWYRTGDLVRDIGDGVLDYVGRRDRMVKRRGYRVELGEIESGLYRFPGIAEAAAIAVPDSESGVKVRAFLAMEDGDADGPPPSMLKLKMFCSQVLLPYMVPDDFEFVEKLPKTSTDKIDYQSLIRSSEAPAIPQREVAPVA